MSFASACVPDQLLNCHPFASLAGNGEFFLRPFSVNDDDVHWGDPQATLLRMRPDDLLETEVENSFDEWITDCPTGENGIRLEPTEGGVAHTRVNYWVSEVSWLPHLGGRSISCICGRSGS